MSNHCYLHLGSNMGNKRAHLDLAIRKIDEELGIVSKISPFYLTSAWGIKNQNDFINVALELQTIFEVRTILSTCQKIETELGRQRSIKWGPRVIDIDILFYNQEIIQDADLNIPHPHLQDRLFVLQPLNDIASEYVHPVLKQSIQDLLAKCTDKGSCKIINDK